jgi:Na+/H+ antiporter NhaC
MLRRVAPVRTDVSEELSASVIRVTRIGELGTTLAVTSNTYFFAVCEKISEKHNYATVNSTLTFAEVSGYHMKAIFVS